MAEAFVRMGEDGLRSVLLAQACEEADPEGAFVPHAAREAASREAAAAVAEPDAAEAFLLARAGRLLDRVAAEHPALGRLASRAGFAPPTGVVLGGAFLLGLAADALGRQRELNLLAFPLLGLVAWNLAVYAAGLVRRLSSRQVEASRAGDLALAWSALRTRLAARTGGAPAFLRRAATRFVGLWFERAGALEGARWRARLHAGAAAFAFGVVAGLYLAGFAFAYRATWESTFLDAGQVRTLLVFLLGPASALLGAPMPDVAAIAAIQAPESGPAAVWIHRWAATAGLLVVIPRLALSLHCAARARQAARSLAPDWGSAYATRLLAAGRGEGSSHAIVPYSMEPTASAAARLRELAYALFGNRARVILLPHVPYGGTPPAEAGKGALVVFDLAQSPEREVHGAFLEALGREGAEPLVLLDHERYAAVATPERLEERRRAWLRVLADTGIEPLDLGPDVDADALLGAARAARPEERARA